MKRRKLPMFAVLAVGIVLLAIPAGAQEVIRAGIDAWHTPNDGSTTIQVNLPTGFFCPGSEPVEEITLKGEPLETDPPLVLGDADTIIERQNDAFPGEPIQIQVQALCLKGSDTLRVQCDTGLTSWEYSAGLNGAQPVTEIIVQDDGSGQGGTFDGQVAVEAVITFTQVASDSDNPDIRPIQDEFDDATGKTLTVTDSIVFASSATPWVHDPGVEGVKYEGELLVGGGCGAPPVKRLPGTTNFHPGWGQGTPTQIDKSKCVCDCKCGAFCRLPVQEQALFAQHGVTPPCRRCNCL